jgi:hypothetical protein
MKEILVSLLMLSSIWGDGGIRPESPYERSGKTGTATYNEAIGFFEELVEMNDDIRLLEYGETDSGKPLHLVVLSTSGAFDPVSVKESGKRILLVNNAIHPGEPCGVDASMILARDLLSIPEYRDMLDSVVLLIIPVYNIGGALNRGCCSRANQLGPDEYGFRGNARNLDLNRDFMKADSRNAKSFARIFREWMPDVFIDTHTTNGADYQAAITYIPTQTDKAGSFNGTYLKNRMIPALAGFMENSGISTCPYVDPMGRYPDEKGIVAFLDHGRYSTGYANLYQTIGFITEAHMLKPYHERVEATFAFLLGVISWMHHDSHLLGESIQAAREEAMTARQVPLNWELDTTTFQMIPFDGYTARTRESGLTGLERLYYDRNAPFTKEIPYFDHYIPTLTVRRPDAYIIPQAWTEAITRLEDNGIRMETLSCDTLLEVELSYITSYHTLGNPWEGHYYHDQLSTSREIQKIQYFAGDKVIFTRQEGVRYLIETLEPEGHDSFFRWNLFDAILGRKEYFSPYLYEETAARLLEEDPKLKAAFMEARSANPDFAKNAWAQLDFIFRRSPDYEKTHNRYPVARFFGNTELPLR